MIVCRTWKANPEFLGKIMPFALQRLETFSDFFPLAQFLLSEQPVYTLEDLVGKMEPEQSAKLLKIAEWELEKTASWDRDTLSSVFQRMAEVEGLKLKQLLPLFFMAMSGSTVSLPLFRWNCSSRPRSYPHAFAPRTRIIIRQWTRPEQKGNQETGKGICKPIRRAN